MKLDLTWSITAIIAVTSILSPIIVTFINNHHNYKIRKLEINSSIKQEVLSNFAKKITENYTKIGITTDFYKYLNLLYIYFNVDEYLINKIMNESYPDIVQFQNDVTKLMKSLSKQIENK